MLILPFQVFYVRKAIVNALACIQGARVYVVHDPGEHFTELAAVRLTRFPFALDETLFLRYEFVHQLVSQLAIKRRGQLAHQRRIVYEHRLRFKRSLFDLRFGERRSLFQSDRMCELFLEVLFGYGKQKKYALREFVLMQNHFHLLITPGSLLALEPCMQLVKGGFSFRAKKELQFLGEVWEKSFTNHRIRDEADYASHCKYIWENPVRAGLVSSPAEYAYSSARSGFEWAEAPQGLKPDFIKASVSHG